MYENLILAILTNSDLWLQQLLIVLGLVSMWAKEPLKPKKL